MENKYERLLQRWKELSKIATLDDIEFLQEIDCIEHFLLLEKEGARYEFVLKFAKEKGLKRVFDIGCAMGHQSEVFIGSDIEYIGINDLPVKNYWNSDRYKYITKQYPFKIEAKETDLAASLLCITWNCYLYEGEKTLKEQCEALTRDFKHVLLYMQQDKLLFVAKYFKGYEILHDNFVYFYN